MKFTKTLLIVGHTLIMIHTNSDIIDISHDQVIHRSPPHRLLYNDNILSCCMRKPTTWSKFSICNCFAQKLINALYDHMKYKGYMKATCIYRDTGMTS